MGFSLNLNLFSPTSSGGVSTAIGQSSSDPSATGAAINTQQLFASLLSRWQQGGITSLAPVLDGTAATAAKNTDGTEAIDSAPTKDATTDPPTAEQWAQAITGLLNVLQTVQPQLPAAQQAEVATLIPALQQAQAAIQSNPGIISQQVPVDAQSAVALPQQAPASPVVLPQNNMQQPDTLAGNAPQSTALRRPPRTKLPADSEPTSLLPQPTDPIFLGRPVAVASVQAKPIEIPASASAMTAPADSQAAVQLPSVPPRGALLDAPTQDAPPTLFTGTLTPEAVQTLTQKLLQAPAAEARAVTPQLQVPNVLAAAVTQAKDILAQLPPDVQQQVARQLSDTPLAQPLTTAPGKPLQRSIQQLQLDATLAKAPESPVQTAPTAPPIIAPIDEQSLKPRTIFFQRPSTPAELAQLQAPVTEDPKQPKKSSTTETDATAKPGLEEAAQPATSNMAVPVAVGTAETAQLFAAPAATAPVPIAASVAVKPEAAFVPQADIDAPHLQVANALSMQAASKRREVRIQLKPDNLGEVEIRIKTGPRQQISAEIVAATPQARQALTQNLAELTANLKEKGITLNTVQVMAFAKSAEAPSITVAPESGNAGREQPGQQPQHQPPNERQAAAEQFAFNQQQRQPQQASGDGGSNRQGQQGETGTGQAGGGELIADAQNTFENTPQAQATGAGGLDIRI